MPLCTRPRLLVSVTDATEALAALAGGADIIDVKDPSRGSLGKADDRIINQVIDAVVNRAPVTAALGELTRFMTFSPSRLSVSMVKLGLSHAAPSWRDDLSAALVPYRPARPVAVAYADHQRAGAPEPQTVLQWAINHRAAALLFDTFIKDGKGLFHWLDDDALRPLVTAAHAAGVQVALAGSLRLGNVSRCVALGADIIAVRGAVCDLDDRTARINAERVTSLKHAIAASASQSVPPAG
jgi:(5-formylfuran-3-yl)methyl phosphate synthase